MPLIDLANPAGSDALAQLAGPFGSNLGGGSFPRSYEFAKRFVSSAGAIEGSGNNAVTSLDDPTYLGFSLMFDISSPLFNGAARGSVQMIEGTEDSSYPSTPSAIGYLNTIGEANRVQYFKAFVLGMLEIQNTRPYYFQTIQGLLESWQKSFEFSVDPFTGTKGEDGITIGCLEAIDLKITALFNLYKMAVYDSMHKRMIVPENLLRFDVYIYVQEIRKFKTVRNWLKALNPSDATPSTNDYVNGNTSQVGFKFTQCLWIPGASGKVFEGVTNVGGEIATTEMKFSYANMESVSQYSGFNSSLPSDRIQANNDPSFKDKVKQFGKDLLMDQVDGAINLAERTASSFLQNLTLGNVYGSRNQILGAIANPQALINAAIGGAIQGNELETFGNSDAVTNLGDNPLGGSDDAPDFQTTKIFDPSTNTLGGLDVINAFGPSGPPNNSVINQDNIFD